MENNKKLELTLFNMKPYGLKAMLTQDVFEEFSDVETDDFETKFKEGAIWEYCGYCDKDLMLPCGQGEVEGWILRQGYCYATINKFCKPLLHSLDKLTEPILDGDLIPIVELAKIAFPDYDFTVFKGGARGKNKGIQTKFIFYCAEYFFCI
jgi:hypothetical protein